MSRKLYWLGNAAKSRVIDEILERLPPDRETLVFDYGCGTAGDWPHILSDYPSIRLVGYEPNRTSYLEARSRLQGRRAGLLTGPVIDTLELQADVIVSFSVLEHVHDRRHYLQTAKRLLAADGLFYLNYDDGHFRNRLSLNAWREWRSELGEWVRNLVAPSLAALGSVSRYQRRAARAEVDALVSRAGFRTRQAYYGNLASLKSLYKVLPPESRGDFARFWLETEARLNREFLTEGPPQMGDTAGLWTQMPSRTLVLEHAELYAERGSNRR